DCIRPRVKSHGFRELPAFFGCGRRRKHGLPPGGDESAARRDLLTSEREQFPVRRTVLDELREDHDRGVIAPLSLQSQAALVNPPRAVVDLLLDLALLFSKPQLLLPVLDVLPPAAD